MNLTCAMSHSTHPKDDKLSVKKCLAPNYNCLVVSKSMLDCGAYSDRCGLITGRAGKAPSVLPE
jgi:hypothetical protein